MNRREVIKLFGVAAAAWPLAAQEDTPRRPVAGQKALGRGIVAGRGERNDYDR